MSKTVAIKIPHQVEELLEDYLIIVMRDSVVEVAYQRDEKGNIILQLTPLDSNTEAEGETVEVDEVI